MGKNNTIIKNYLYNLLYQILTFITPLITVPYLARVLGANLLGIYAYMFSISTIFTTFFLFGNYTYGNRQVAYCRCDKAILSKNFCEILFLRFILCLVCSFFYIVIGTNDYYYYEYYYYFFPYTFGVLIDCSWLFVGVEDMKVSSLKNIVAKSLSVVLILLFVKNKSDFNIYILIIGLTTLLSNLSVYLQLYKYICFITPDFTQLRNHFMASLSIFLPELITIINSQIGKIIMKFSNIDIKQIAFYDQTEKLVYIPLTFVTVIGTTIMPRLASEFAKGNLEKVKRLLNNSGSITLFLSIPIVFGLQLISSEFVFLYLGKEFVQVAKGVTFLAPTIITNSIIIVCATQYFTAIGRTDIMSKASLITCGLNLMLNFTLVPYFGFLGSIVSIVISNIVLMTIYIYKLKNILIKKEILWSFIRYLGSSIVMCMCISVTQFNNDFISLFIRSIFGLFVYIISLILMRDKWAMFLIRKFY